MFRLFTQGYAVVIGIGADLPVTLADASAVADLLLDSGRCAYPPDQVRLLTSEQACRENVLAALDWLAASTSPATTALVYFSGHGLEIPGYYLLPYGYDYADLPGTAISSALFTDKLRAIQAGKLLVLLDCCHAGGQAEAKETPTVKSPLPLDTAELKRSHGRVVIASSRKNELSWVGKTYSVFTEALLEGLAGYGAAERDGYARVLDLALYIGRMVPDRTADKQHPILKVSNLEDNFALAYYAGGAQQPKSLSWGERLPPASSTINAEQATHWRRILANRQRALMLIEERMSEYTEYQEIPLQLIDNKRRTEKEIGELEQKLGLR